MAGWAPTACRVVRSRAYLLLAWLAWSWCAACTAPAPPDEAHYLDVARETARWLQSISVETPYGPAWPDEASHPVVVTTGLGTGVAGITLFFLGLYETSAEAAHLTEARRGADYLLRRFAATRDTADFALGLYNGIAGEAFVLNQVFRVTQDARYRQGALERIRQLHQQADPASDRLAWNQYHDVLNGTAGIGLVLLYAAREMEHAPSLALATRAGEALLRQGQRANGGRYWTIGSDIDFNVPNFSHGTGGVGYFLATLYAATGRTAFLDGARAAATYLQAVAKTEGGVFLVPYGIPNDGFDIPYDIGWAHGPAGTARLFYRLWQVTEEQAWLEVVHASARGLLASGVPDAPAHADFGEAPFRRDMRFGTAGAAAFLLDLYATTDEALYLTAAERIVDDLIGAAQVDSTGLRWRLPRYGFQGNEGALTAFTGYYYGASGLGGLMLRMHTTRHYTAPPLILPDNPFFSP